MQPSTATTRSLLRPNLRQAPLYPRELLRNRVCQQMRRKLVFHAFSCQPADTNPTLTLWTRHHANLP